MAPVLRTKWVLGLLVAAAVAPAPAVLAHDHFTSDRGRPVAAPASVRTDGHARTRAPEAPARQLAADPADSGSPPQAGPPATVGPPGTGQGGAGVQVGALGTGILLVGLGLGFLGIRLRWR
ncbi:hypothetical protein [Streptomyces sp. NPDC048845]|uniref:hypothetical protein n=1 Tax=Streptomyces sp. NPDC048845 TaxID=3155390 RepID=UPI003418628D